MGEKSTAFALIGDRYHNSDYIRTALGKTLVRELGVTIDFTDEVKLLNAETLRGYKMLIIFRDGMIWPDGYGARSAPQPTVSEPPVPEIEATAVHWLTDAQGQAIKDFVEGGGVALFYHNSTYIAQGNETFREVLGAATEGHPPVRPFKVMISNSDHPITRGVSDFIVTDEQHFMTYHKDPAHVFMRSVNEDGLTHGDLGTSCEAGWAYDYGKGRVCYLSPGHTIPALWNPAYEKIQQNAVRWLLRET
ncbi:MAG: ThuA domain-containing protein [Candidatus Poribacteria bacterium]|nr:ThuA domain-containing protein [Candidatus Poribacteria bacterium]